VATCLARGAAAVAMGYALRGPLSWPIVRTVVTSCSWSSSIVVKRHFRRRFESPPRWGMTPHLGGLTDSVWVATVAPPPVARAALCATETRAPPLPPTVRRASTVVALQAAADGDAACG